MNQFYELINKNNYEIKGFWICDEKFGAKNKNALVWYYKIFGLKVFMLLGVFFVFFKMTSIYHSIFNNYSVSFEKLCKKNKVNFFYTKSPNSHKLYDWTVKNEIDITIIMVGHILKKKIIYASKIGTINKHASLLPSNKGVFPYFWAKLKNEKQGCSIHFVNEKIDDGSVIYQESIENSTSSMVEFYFYVYKNYGKMICSSLNNISNNLTQTILTTQSSYNSFPTNKDFEEFKKSNGHIIKIKDLLLNLKR